MIQHLRIDLADPTDLAQCLQTGDSVVVVDLFRATSTIQILVDRRCEVVPLASIADIDNHNFENRNLLRVGEWRGTHLKGSFADNSPTEMLRADIAGKTIDFLSSNGTGAILAAKSAALVICSSLFNEKAVAEVILKRKGRWWLCPAGCRGDRRIEDDYVCACIGDALVRQGIAPQTRLKNLMTELDNVDRSTLLNGPGAQFLIKTGAVPDLDFILGGNYQSKLVPRLTSTNSLIGTYIEEFVEADVLY